MTVYYFIFYILNRKEIKEGAILLLEKMKKYKPKIAVFNGKGKSSINQKIVFKSTCIKFCCIQ